MTTFVLGGESSSSRVGLVVCEGCCCGRQAPAGRAGVARLRRLAQEHPDRVSIRISGCLGRCAEADVVVITPSPEGRRRGGRPVWLGLVDDYAMDRLGAWLADGGPGIAELPADLALHIVDRPRAGQPLLQLSAR